MSTRPRISFDSRGWCNACQWMEKKNHIDWNQRQDQLIKLLDHSRSSDGSYDCLVPVSGGKDGSYVAYNLKHKYGMNPLCLTVTPPLPLDLGEKNLRSFVNSGYSHISVNTSYKAMQTLNKQGFIKKGFPYFGWLTAIHSIPVRFALMHNIDLIFYGEDGEVEYGGTTKTADNPLYSVDYMKDVYLDGGYLDLIENYSLPANDILFFKFPDLSLYGNSPDNLKIAHWSYFENWDPYRNYLVAKEHCGLSESQETNAGTFTNFAQNDQALYALHTYLMYLKFGFGRANQDASIEIRRGAMDREQALTLVRLYDGQYPEQFIQTYLEYFEMSQQEFDSVIDAWANKSLFTKSNGRWKPTFVPQ